jgi:predicted ribosome quality control (RQC) complex YloA/Tae2 family protein
MTSNYFTLYHIAALLNDQYSKSVIAQVYSQEKNTLSILLYLSEPHTITISCNSRDNFILAKSGDNRSRTNSVDLLPDLIDKHIESVYLSATDRVIYIKTTGEQWICIEMFASKANVLLCNRDGMVLDAFLNKKDLQGEMRQLQHQVQKIGLAECLPTPETFTEVFQTNGDPVRSLKTALPKLGSILAEEVIVRSATKEENAPAAERTERVYTAAKEVMQQLLSLTNVEPLIYFDDRSPQCLSPIALRHLHAHRSESFPDLFTGIQRFISFERSSQNYLSKKKEITSWLTKESEKAARTIISVEHELAESARAEQYELFGNLIMAHLPSLSKGERSASVENTFSQNELVTIPLEPTMTPQKNAERYFEKAKRSKTAKEESRLRLTSLKQRLTSVNDLLEKSKEITDSISLKNFIHSYGGAVKELGYMTEKEQEELPPFKIFMVEGGFTVYAGKNSVNNDLLTFRYAKPNDLWFHARGSSGSHVVLKLGTGEGTPTKKAVEQAASIAAYYSKMKNAKHVPVAMTERKFIHKPKGAPAGTVALDKEKVIFVQPILPENK